MKYQLFLKDFIAEYSIGIHLFELEKKQRVKINVELTVESDFDDDGITSVLDYDFLIEELRILSTSGHFNLQETLCWRIANFCISRSEIHAVSVSTEKIDVYPDTQSVGCKLVLTK